MEFIDGTRSGMRTLIETIYSRTETNVRRAIPLMALLVGILGWSSTAIAQDDLSELKDECAAVGVNLEDLRTDMQALDACKRALEIRTLRADLDAWPEWVRGAIVAAVSAGLALAIGIVSGFLTNRFAFEQAKRKEVHEFDQAVHRQRLELYPKLTKSAEPLAIYFPPDGEPEPGEVEIVTKVTPAVCAKIGRMMSEWYFCKGGLLLSPESRDSYFNLARALTRASRERQLMVPEFPEHANDIHKEMLKKYRQHLNIRSYSQKQDECPEARKEQDLAEVENWNFGGETVVTEPAKQLTSEDKERELAQKFKDYVFLQQISSLLRTELSEDIRSRRRPVG